MAALAGLIDEFLEDTGDGTDNEEFSFEEEGAAGVPLEPDRNEMLFDSSSGSDNPLENSLAVSFSPKGARIRYGVDARDRAGLDVSISGMGDTPNYILHSGWLKKRGQGIIKKWLRRWFTLTNDSLTYCKSPTDEKVKTIPMLDVYGIYLSPVEKGDDILHRLVLQTRHRDFQLEADTAHEAVEWVEIIEPRIKVTVFYASQTADRYSRGRLTRLKTLLDAHRVEYQERDVFYMRDEDIETLWDRAGTQELPLVFVNGVFVGGQEHLQEITDDGDLDKVLHFGTSDE